jgi:hypothetical protein
MNKKILNFEYIVDEVRKAVSNYLSLDGTITSFCEVLGYTATNYTKWKAEGFTEKVKRKLNEDYNVSLNFMETGEGEVFAEGQPANLQLETKALEIRKLQETIKSLKAEMRQKQLLVELSTQNNRLIKALLSEMLHDMEQELPYGEYEFTNKLKLAWNILFGEDELRC